MTRSDERRLAIVALLALPDPPELAGRRGHRVTQRRRAFTEVDVLKRDLATAYAAHRRQAYADDVSCVVSRRRGGARRLTLARRRA
jgi:hypothetical protein